MELPQLKNTSASGSRTPRVRKTKTFSPFRPWTQRASTTPQLTSCSASNAACMLPTNFSSPSPTPDNPANAIEPVVSNPVPLNVVRTSGFHQLELEPELPAYPQRAAPPPYILGTYGGLGTADPNRADESHDHLPPYRSTETLELPAYSEEIVVAQRSPRALANVSRGDVRRWYGRQAEPQRIEDGHASVGQRRRRGDVDVVRLKLERRWRCSLFALAILLLVFIAVGSSAVALSIATGDRHGRS
ncbi:hypothetical protein EJ03DRAFT_367252 [Teratosphaeria nubilosa]|uniref:Uncharacterized protein n=1 Tax=Teratosphaeria nubilosa TaxID=161662 RepID=A0A6G1L1T9_9PEZI|nr:hypothetical protein EJ03DRAFT_367252 [Teratosphaeria nubilosa]